MWNSTLRLNVIPRRFGTTRVVFYLISCGCLYLGFTQINNLKVHQSLRQYFEPKEDTLRLEQEEILEDDQTLTLGSEEKPQTLLTPPAHLRHMNLGEVMSSIFNSTDSEILRDPVTMHRPRICPSRAVLTYDGGRTGNQIFEFMPAWAIAQESQATFLVPEQMIQSFEGIFPHMTSPRGDLDILMIDCAHLWKSRRTIHHEDITDVHSIFPAGSVGWLELLDFPNKVTTVTYKAAFSHIPELRKQFRFSTRIQQIVQTYLHTVRQAVSETQDIEDTNKSPDNDITYIGIHVRRTDYQSAMFNLYGTELTPIGKDYFLRGMNIYRQRYKNVVFLVVSDDMPWCKKHFASLSDLIFFPGGDRHSSLLDLALLANCNHTFITYGTFALSGSILSGGDLLLAKDPAWQYEVWEHMKKAWPGRWTEVPIRRPDLN